MQLYFTRKKFILLVTVLTFQLTAQVKTIRIKKPITDTIDYSYILFKGYSLTRVIEKSTRIFHSCSKDLWFSSPVYPSLLRRNDRDKSVQLKETDTSINLYWYIIKNVGCVREKCGHDDYIWKLRLNKRSNIMVADRIYCFKEAKLVRLYFKVIKFSEFEIILEDLQVKPLRRLYYFQKKE